jgi:uncharacterized protein YbjQ (UPF0145 family)
MMFDRVIGRALRRAERRAMESMVELTERMRAEAPHGIEVEATSEGVRLSGRGLRLRIALEPALRRLLAGLR